MNKRAKGHTHTYIYIYTYIFMCQARVVCFSVLLQDRARELARLLQERPGVLRSFLATRYGREWRSEIEPYTKTKFLGYERLGKELAKTNSRYNKALGGFRVFWQAHVQVGKVPFGWSYFERIKDIIGRQLHESVLLSHQSDRPCFAWLSPNDL